MIFFGKRTTLMEE